MKESKENALQQRKQRRKLTKRLNRLKKSGKLKRHVREAFCNIKATRQAKKRRMAINIEEDWLEDRKKVMEDQCDDDNIPLDMMDADIDWQNSAFAEKIRRMCDIAEDFSDIETKPRRFKGEPDADFHELLPVKVGGKLVKQSRLINKCDEDGMQEEEKDKSKEPEKQLDYSTLTAAELLAKRKELINSSKLVICNSCYEILADPQNEISKLHELLRYCTGENVHSLAKNGVIPLALASLMQVFVDLIPGYHIRTPTQDELAQKMKKETKKFLEYELAFLKIYVKYLQILEKNVSIFMKGKKESMEESDLTKKAMLSLKCLCRIVLSTPHFNYSTKIIDLIVRLAVCNIPAVVKESCSTLGSLFENDIVFETSAYGTGSIAKIVVGKKCNVPPELLSTFLKLKIKEVNNDSNKKREKTRIFGKKVKLHKEKASKSKQKYIKQLKKLEADLKEIEAQESFRKRDKFATETMNHVFATYFRIIKRMPTTKLLSPVLEGLSKFAHLINIEFFNDIVFALESLVEQQRLRLIDSLHCVYVVFIILSGEGVAINVDPFLFYRLLYRLLPGIPFESDPVVLGRILSLTLRSLNIMFNVRRKCVSPGRVAAFIKRLLAITFLLPCHGVIGVLLVIRSFLISHPNLLSLVEESEGIYCGGNFNASIDDPDYSNAQTSSIIAELEILSKHQHPLAATLACHLRNGLPSVGRSRLNSQIITKKPYEWLEEDWKNCSLQPQYSNDIRSFSSKEKMQLNSKNLHSIISKWIECRICNLQRSIREE